MPPPAFSRLFGSTVNTVFKRFLLSLIRTSLIYLIAFLFVHLPTLWNYLLNWGKNDQIHFKQKEIRAKLTDDNDPSSPYRAVQVLKELKNQPEDQIETLADIPEVCLQRYPKRETMGVREILGVEDEKQTNGKIFKKYSLGDYHFQTYEQAYQQIEQIGKGFLSLQLKKGDPILIYAETRPQWLLTAFAAFRHGFILVTLYSTLGEEALKHGINQSKVKLIITSIDLTNKLSVKTFFFLLLHLNFFFFFFERKSWVKPKKFVM